MKNRNVLFLLVLVVVRGMTAWALAQEAAADEPEHPALAALEQVVRVTERKANSNCPQCVELQKSIQRDWEEAIKVDGEEIEYQLQLSRRASSVGAIPTKEDRMIPLTKRMEKFTKKYSATLDAASAGSLCGQCSVESGAAAMEPPRSTPRAP